MTESRIRCLPLFIVLDVKAEKSDLQTKKMTIGSRYFE